jgi:hypothetical protein
MSQDIKKTSRLVSIDSIVHNVMNDLDNPPQNSFLKFKQWAIRGLKAINMHVMTSIEIQGFTVDQNNIVNLPDDYIRYSKIGVVREGRIWTLTRDDSIPITREEVNGAVVNYEDLEDAENMPDLTTWYAAPPKAYNLAFHRYDKEKNRLIFSGDMIGESVLVEYISTGVNLRGEVLLPVEAEEALIAWVHKQRTLNGKDVSESEKSRRDYEFKKAMYDLIGFVNTFTLDDLIDTVNAGSSLLAKR